MGNSAEDDYKQLVREHRKHLVEALHAASRDYDQAILAVASGTFALSVTFSNNIVPAPAPGSPALLLLAWASLALSMLAIILSFVTSQLEIRFEIAAVDEGKDVKRSWAAWATWVLNVLGGIKLILGLSLLGWYAIANVAAPKP